jgi:hypothetical protein
MQRSRKFLLLLLFFALILGIVVVAVFNKEEKSTPEVNDSGLREVPLDKRPVVSLTPSFDGHYLKFRVENLGLEADSLDYILEYVPANGVTQGIPGTVAIGKNEVFETDFLLGTESSGKFRYDEGVSGGSIELRFRKDKVLVAKFKTDFKMNKTKNGFEVLMDTIGGSSAGKESVFASQ